MLTQPLRIVNDPIVRIVAAALVLLWGMYQSLWNITQSNAQVDEGTYQAAGWQYVHGVFVKNLEHPPTAKYIFGLSQLIFGQSYLTDRWVSGIAVILGALITFFWLRREVGWWTALLAGGLWLLLPRGIGSLDPTREDRYGLLDPVMVLFLIAAMACAWQWMRTERWWWVALAGLMMGLSVTSKISTLWALPAFLILPIMWRRWRHVWLGGLIFSGVFVATFVVVYLPLGIAPALHYMVTFQSTHDAQGHIVMVAGKLYEFPPWWAGLWFALQAMGKMVCALLVVGIIAAFVNRPGRLILFLTVGFAGIMGFYLGIARVSLPNYYYPWLWFGIVIAAIGIGTLLRERWFGTLVGVVAVLGLALSSVRLSASTWHFHHTGIGRVPAVLTEHHRDGSIFITDVDTAVIAPNFQGHGKIRGNGPFDAVVVGNASGVSSNPQLEKALTTDKTEFEVVHVDDVTLYLPHGLLEYRSGMFTVVPSS